MQPSLKRLFSPKQVVCRKNYRADRMSKIRGDISGWLQEYESAKTAKHREMCMNQIQMNLKKYEWYGHR